MITRKLVPNAHSYKTQANAQKVLDKALADLDPENTSTCFIRTAVLAQEDGRFTAFVMLDSSSHWLMHYFIDRHVAVFVG